MPGLFGYLAAGAAEGVGKSMVEQAKAKREAALEELRHRRLLERDEASRAFERGENEKNRAALAERDAEMITLEDGTAGLRKGSKVETLTGPDGKPVKAITTQNTDPSEVKTAEWLVRNGVAADAKEAWDKVRSARTSADSRAKLIIDAYKAMKEDPADQRPDSVKRAEAEQMVDSMISGGGGGKKTSSDMAAEASSKSPSDKGFRRPDGVTDAQVLSEARQAIKRGADKAKVSERLRSMGIDPAAL